MSPARAVSGFEECNWYACHWAVPRLCDGGAMVEADRIPMPGTSVI